MALNNERKAELADKLKSIAANFDPRHADEPSGTTISRLANHGILQALADPDSFASRLKRHIPDASPIEAFALSNDLSLAVQDFF